MASRLYGGLLVIGCVILAGCWSAGDVDEKISSTKPSSGRTSTAPIAEPSIPSVQYLAVDGLAPAVIVAGHSLAYTRQMLPVDAEGTLVGEGSAEMQIDQVLANVEKLLAESGSGLDRLVKVNVYADSAETADLFRKQMSGRLDAVVQPAVCAVVSPLPVAQARIAVDAVAIADHQGNDVVLRRCQGVAGDKNCADVAVMPRGGVVYLSGQPDKSPLAEATVKSMTTQLDVLDQLELQPSQIAQLKVFVDSAAHRDTVLNELKRLFSDQLLPPVTFVQWIASAPVEIEVVGHLPRASWQSGETLRFYTPAGVKPSPTFSKVALVQTDRQIFISGLVAREAGGGEDQVRDVFTQLQKILSESGSDLQHLAKATYYVSDDDASDMLNRLRPEYYDSQRPPAASKAMVHGVGRAGRTLAIDMIAVGGKNEGPFNNSEDSP